MKKSNYKDTIGQKILLGIGAFVLAIVTFIVICL